MPPRGIYSDVNLVTLSYLMLVSTENNTVVETSSSSFQGQYPENSKQTRKVSIPTDERGP